MRLPPEARHPGPQPHSCGAARTPGAPRRIRPGPGPLPDHRRAPSPSCGLPARTRAFRSPLTVLNAISSSAHFPGRRLPRSHGAALSLLTMPSTHSHTYTLQPAHAAIGLWVPSRQPARPYLGRAPLRTGPCSSGLSEQRALDPAGGPQSRPRRSRVGAGPELRRGGSLERHRQRGGAAPASESEPRPRLPDARLGRAFWGNCGEGKDCQQLPEISES